jgi:hypothetical protein
MPGDKSLGLAGFSGLFLKVRWLVVKLDFYRLCHEFWARVDNLQSMNDSFITLILNVLSPEGPNGYRLISLLNICLKLLTKLLANRLQTGIQRLIHENQYGFIKSRTIPHCLAWAYEYLHHFHRSKRK